ncbi:hypothetical protein K2173_027659 [Erythroxylum novogranatense]|uniref:NAC domain-containing protein n=1 Tax=Erythroxylum novogranatense TaxID=1862640 RepID=A0AAV8TZN2_9ROSI|nr:hypothetical protein K2173_027659 [Erythroxylum novogranatense]
MDKFSFVRDGTIRLPPGFRFQPTDEELVFQYLKCKILSWPLPASIIPEINVCKHDPWDLPGDLEQERYFFSYKQAKYPNGNRINRATGSGFWKATGVDKRIVPPSRNIDVVGMKKTLVFYSGKPPNGCRTDWIMHEYRLARLESTPSHNKHTKSSLQNSFSQLEKWVLCRVFPKRRNAGQQTGYEVVQICKDNKIELDVVVTKPVFFDFLARNDVTPFPCSSSSSSSSNITEASLSSSAGADDDHEESSNTHP